MILTENIIEGIKFISNTTYIAKILKFIFIDDIVVSHWGSYQNNVSCAHGYPIHLLESYFEKPNLIYGDECV